MSSHAGTEEFLRRLTHLSLGLPDHWTPFLRSNAQSGDNFEGCVGNLTINNVVVDLDEATDIRGVELGEYVKLQFFLKVSFCIF